MHTNENDFTSFLKISVYLTGFSEIELLGTGMVEIYYDTILRKNDAANLKLFFAEVNALLAGCNDDEKEAIAAIKSRLIPDSNYSGITKKIILLWYTGAWNIAGQVPEIVSAEAFVHGLMWPAVQTHPPGAKQPGYDSWSEPPIQIPTK